jgi:hypothetical protein
MGSKDFSGSRSNTIAKQAGQKTTSWLGREELAKSWRMSCLGSDAMSACQSEKADRANEKRSKLSCQGARVLFFV